MKTLSLSSPPFSPSSPFFFSITPQTRLPFSLSPLEPPPLPLPFSFLPCHRSHLHTLPPKPHPPLLFPSSKQPIVTPSSSVHMSLAAPQQPPPMDTLSHLSLSPQTPFADQPTEPPLTTPTHESLPSQTQPYSAPLVNPKPPFPQLPSL
ncbi:hypothetical protein RIF29_08855 [Crotalaria pallida]|uniref:Uncharacterized protein n=1 Tax=Crotalaria pallida TaxID=3830 RepID=A0AAN9FR84_CROPI